MDCLACLDFRQDLPLAVFRPAALAAPKEKTGRRKTEILQFMMRAGNEAGNEAGQKEPLFRRRTKGEKAKRGQKRPRTRGAILKNADEAKNQIR